MGSDLYIKSALWNTVPLTYSVTDFVPATICFYLFLKHTKFFPVLGHLRFLFPPPAPSLHIFNVCCCQDPWSVHPTENTSLIKVTLLIISPCTYLYMVCCSFPNVNPMKTGTMSLLLTDISTAPRIVLGIK